MSTTLTVSFYHLYNFVTTRAQKGFPISHFPISHFPIPNQVFSAEQVQSEDPRLEWRALQEDMLRQYLVTAQEDLQVHLHHPNECLRIWRRSRSGRTKDSSSISCHHEPQLSGALSDQMSDQNIHYNDNQVNTRICQRFDHSVCVRAVRDIAAGEEVTNRWSQYENNVISWLETVLLLL